MKATESRNGARTGADGIADLFIIGGGVNGCGIARDAAGRGLSVVLAEMNDLGSATSSSSTKLFHGGLRYLEYFEFRLVHEALVEREVLLRAMPHISWPKRFVLPYHEDMRFESETPTSKLLSTIMPWMRGRRPAWLIRLGLFIYDHMGGRKILPATTTVDLASDPAGAPLKAKFRKAFEYSDCWVEDSRLVVLNARDARERGATILPRHKVVSAERHSDHWKIRTSAQFDGESGGEDRGEQQTYRARILVNAGGPWVEQIARNTVHMDATEGVRLVRGSHIVTHKLFDHDKCYFFQGEDGRVIFAIPYETDFTLIGTTDQEHEGNPGEAVCTPEEQAYLCDLASRYFDRPVTVSDIVWTYSGVRPLYDDGASSATAATRDYVLSLDAAGGAPVLNVFGGKITTYRRLAETALAKLSPHIPHLSGNWTAGVPMPGGDFPVDGFGTLVSEIRKEFPFVGERWAKRLVRAYGTEAKTILGDAKDEAALGKNFGATLTASEVAWLMENEFAATAEDVVWRRSKLGLHLSPGEAKRLDAWMKSARIANGKNVAAE